MYVIEFGSPNSCTRCYMVGRLRGQSAYSEQPAFCVQSSSGIRPRRGFENACDRSENAAYVTLSDMNRSAGPKQTNLPYTWGCSGIMDNTLMMTGRIKTSVNTECVMVNGRILWNCVGARNLEVFGCVFTFINSLLVKRRH